MTVREGEPTPPAHVAVYVAALGVEKSIAFLLEFGGAELYLPEKVNPRSRLAQVAGTEGAAELIKRRERIPARIPIPKRWIASVWRHQGLPNAEIARRLHTTDKTVRTWFSDARSPRQLNLFD